MGLDLPKMIYQKKPLLLTWEVVSLYVLLVAIDLPRTSTVIGELRVNICNLDKNNFTIKSAELETSSRCKSFSPAHVFSLAYLCRERANNIYIYIYII